MSLQRNSQLDKTSSHLCGDATETLNELDLIEEMLDDRFDKLLSAVATAEDLQRQVNLLTTERRRLRCAVTQGLRQPSSATAEMEMAR